MKFSRITLYLIIAIVAFGLGILLDRAFLDFPYLTLDPQINILDGLNLLVTIIIALMIPFFISKLIDDVRGVKSFIIDELKELFCLYQEVKSVISTAHSKGSFSPQDRDKIIYKFNELELKVNSVIEQIKIAFEDESAETEETLKDILFKYSEYVTGGELMTSAFTSVDERFFRENNTEFSKVETRLKVLIQKVHKF